MSWSDDDWGKPIFPTRFGSPQGHATERKMLDAVGGFDGIRTKIRTNPDGSTTILKTRGGMPAFMTTPAPINQPKNKIAEYLYFTGVPRDTTYTVGYSPLTDGNVTHICRNVGDDNFSYPSTYSTGAANEFVPLTNELIGQMTWFSNEITTSDGQPVIVSWTGMNGFRGVSWPDVREPRPVSEWPHESQKIKPVVWVNGEPVPISLPIQHGVLSAAIAKSGATWLLRVVGMHDTDQGDATVYTFEITSPVSPVGKFTPVTVSGLSSAYPVSFPMYTSERPCSPPLFNQSADKFLWVAYGYDSGLYLMKLGEVSVSDGVFVMADVKADMPSDQAWQEQKLLAADYDGDTLIYSLFVGYQEREDQTGSVSQSTASVSRSTSGYDNLYQCDSNVTYDYSLNSSPGSFTQSINSLTRYKLISSGVTGMSIDMTADYIKQNYESFSGSFSVSSHNLLRYRDGGGACVFQTSPMQDSILTLNVSKSSQITRTIRNTNITPSLLACDLRANVLVTLLTFEDNDYSYNRTLQYAETYLVARPVIGGYTSYYGTSQRLSTPPTTAPISETSTTNKYARLLVTVGGTTLYDTTVQTGTDTVDTSTPYGGTSFLFDQPTVISYQASNISLRTITSLITTNHHAVALGVFLHPVVCALSGKRDHAFVQVFWPERNKDYSSFVVLDGQTGGVIKNSVVPVKYSPGPGSTISGPLFLPKSEKFR